MCEPVRANDARLMQNMQTTHQIYALASHTPHLDCLLFLFTIRARNVFVNGLFNDCWCTLFSLMAVLSLLQQRSPSRTLGLFSLAASVKMNALLWAPAVAFHFVHTIGLKATMKASIPGLLWQFAVGLPFLVANPSAYISRSFDLQRTFTWFNSVNWKFLPPVVFYSAPFRYLLLLLHISGLVFILFRFRYLYAPVLDPPAVSPAKAQLPVQGYAALLVTTHFVGAYIER